MAEIVGSGLLALADRAVAPTAILVLCVIAGIGTCLLLPSRKGASARRLGGVILALAAVTFAILLAHGLRGEEAGQGTSGIGFYFWAFSAIAVFAAMRVITHPRPVYAALYFILTVLASAGLFVLLNAEFMAAALVLIYAGAILITYLFVIMLAASAQSGRVGEGSLEGVGEYDRISRDPGMAAILGFVLMGLLLFLISDKGTQLPPGKPLTAAVEGEDNEQIMGTTQSVGAYLFENQLVNLELAGLILTVSMVGAIIIARKRTSGPANLQPSAETIVATLTPLSDDPHSIPVYGTTNPHQKAFPET